MDVGETDTKNGFYEKKGMKRQMVIMGHETFDSLKRLAKEHKLTQGEILDVVIDFASLNEDLLESMYKAKRELKVVGRSRQGDLVKRMKNLSPEQMKAIEAIVAGVA